MSLPATTSALPCGGSASRLTRNSLQRTVYLTNTVLDKRCSLCYNAAMNREETRQIISRRTRPAKAPLSREVIVSTALDILRREGIAGLSLRKVAAALDT